MKTFKRFLDSGFNFQIKDSEVILREDEKIIFEMPFEEDNKIEDLSPTESVEFSEFIKNEFVFEYDKEKEEKKLRKAEYEYGREQGREEGRIEGER
jgi:hypothetical protein